jgi:hypothetical protein
MWWLLILLLFDADADDSNCKTPVPLARKESLW